MAVLIVVDYKSIEKTIEYIRHFCSNIVNMPQINVVIIENGESHEAESVIHKTFSFIESRKFLGKDILIFEHPCGKIAYCYSGGNVGYAKGNNLGTKVSDLLFHDEYYIISNNDLRFDEKLNWAEVAALFNERPDVAVIGPRVIGLDGRDQSPNRRLEPVKDMIVAYFVNLKPFKWKGDIDYTGESKMCYRISGCFMFVRASAFRDIDGFDEGTFMYAEEMILSERLKKKGYGVFFWNDFTLTHNHGETVNKHADFLQPAQWCFDSYKYYFRCYRNVNRVILWASEVSFLIYKSRRRLRRFIKSIIKTFRRGKKLENPSSKSTLE